MALYITHIGAFYVLPLLFHFSWSTLLLCHMRDVITSLILTMLFMLSHNAEPIKRYPTHNQCWYTMQVETSCTYGNGIAGALSGGLNYQIEHHLFPRVCSTHYPALSPLIRAVCARHNVAYTVSVCSTIHRFLSHSSMPFMHLYVLSIGENFMSTLRYMKKAGIGAMETGF
jgi:fatty acid desaturase (delta-4 desaturase)